MNFLSLPFLILFIFTYLLYWHIADRYKKYVLILVSCIFYSFFSSKFLIHLILVITTNYLLLRFLGKSKQYLKLSIGFNVLNLCFFKYFYFLLEIVGSILQIEFLQKPVTIDAYISQLLGIAGFHIILPMTISYYSFQLISLAVDYRKGEIEAPRYSDFLAYVLFFPVMIAGPILRFKEINQQFAKPTMSKDDMLDGIWLFSQGIVKKALLSLSLTSLIAPIFASPEEYSGSSLLFTSYLFAINLYLDFSGLTDLARGLAKLFGLHLPENFKAPFFLSGFGDFWRRWHLTFSFWIRDYIYIPLGGSRRSEWRNHYNLVLTFGLGGVWHGASMNYVLWGVFTGIFIAIERIFNQRGWYLFPKIPYVYPVVKYLFVIHIYFISWILFFTPTVAKAFSVMERIVTLQPGKTFQQMETGIYIILFGILFHAIQEWPDKFKPALRYRQVTIPIIAFVLTLALVATQTGNIDFAYQTL
ncbi:MAG: MBOAT family O-acyltransferase [Spirochaetota bacterium]